MAAMKLKVESAGETPSAVALVAGHNTDHNHTLTTITYTLSTTNTNQFATFYTPSLLFDAGVPRVSTSLNQMAWSNNDQKNIFWALI